MKDPQIDLYSHALAGYQQSLGFKRKFLRLWGTETVDGPEGMVEVLKEKHKYYPRSHLIENEKLFRHLKMWKSLNEAEPEGIESAWININPDKVNVYLDDNGNPVTAENTLIDESIAQQINHGIDPALWHTWDVAILSYDYAPLNPDIPGETTAEMVKRVKEYAMANYEHILDNCRIEGDSESLIDRLVSKYVLLDSDGNFDVTISNVTKTAVTVPVKRVYGQPARTEIVNNYTLTLKAKRITTVTNTDYIVTKILNTRSATEKAELQTLQNDYLYDGARETTNDFFYMGRMRKSVFSTNMLRTVSCNQLIQDSIDSGYQKKKVKWYKKLFVIIIIVIIVIVACTFTGPGGCSAAMSLADAALVATAVAIGLAVTSMAMAAWGDEEGAGFAAKMSSVASKVAAIIGIFNIVNGVTAGLTQASAEAAATNAGLEAGSDAFKQYIVDYTRGITIGGVRNYVTNMITSQVGGMFELNLQNLMRVSKFIMKNRQDDIMDEFNKNKSELEKIADENAAKESSQQRELAWDFVRTYTSPLSHDWSPFSCDEYKYEPTRTTFHTGNILRGHIGVGLKTLDSDKKDIRFI